MKFTYRNYKGEISERNVNPARIWYGTSEYHEGEQFFLRAFDHDKKAMRDFAFNDIIPEYAANCIAELEKPSREKFYYPIVMPVDADGQGPADLKDAAKLTWEVWDQELMRHGTFDFLADAIDLANELNARRVREGGKVE